MVAGTHPPAEETYSLVGRLLEVMAPPAGRQARVRRALLLVNLILAVSIFSLFLNTSFENPYLKLVACSALVWLAVLWIHTYRHPIYSIKWNFLAIVPLLAVGIAVREPIGPTGLLFLSMLYGVLCYRCFTLSGGAVVLAVLTYSSIHIVSLGYSMDALTSAPHPLMGLLQVPGMAISAGATHMLARLLEARHNGTKTPSLSDLQALVNEANLDQERVARVTLDATYRVAGQETRQDTRLLIGDDGRMSVVDGSRDLLTILDTGSMLARSWKSLGTGDVTVASADELSSLTNILGLSPGTTAVYLVPLAVAGSLKGLIAIGTKCALHPSVIEGLRAVAAQTGLLLETLDITAGLRQREAGFRALVQNASDLILVIDPDLKIVDLAPTAGGMLGYQPEELLGTSLTDLIHQDDLGEAIAAVAAMGATEGTSPALQWRLQRRDGSWMHAETVGNNLLADPSIGGIVLSARDVSERKALEASILHKVQHDELTGLPNRAAFMNRLEAALENSISRDVSIGVLFLDLDRFKFVNDSLGHEAGNRLLIQVARRLQGSVRPGDTVARLSGDEFAILLDNITSEVPAIDVAERILYELQEAIRIDGYEVFASTSIGIAFGPGGLDVVSASNVLRNADLAMYETKNRGRSGYTVFNQQINARAIDRVTLETELRYAVSNGQFRVFYQPLVQLRTGRVDEVEALVRWMHPSRGLLLPDTFISLAEETGLIEPIGQWVLEEACKQGQIWEKERPGAPPLNLNVNLSVRQFQQRDLVQAVDRVLHDTGIDPRQLTLEITESVALDDAEAAVATMRELKKLGVQLSIDDFGTGYSALSYLKQFPVDALKIDRSFIEGLNYDHGDVAIVKAVIAFARTMNLSVTAEGVETPDQLRQLRILGCDRGQGFYFATPLPGVELSLDSKYGTGRLSTIDPPRLLPRSGPFTAPHDRVNHVNLQSNRKVV